MAEVKISTKFNPDPHPYIKANGRLKRGNYCRACGAPLTDPVSIARGFGRECWKNIPVIVVFDIPAGQPNTGMHGDGGTDTAKEDQLVNQDEAV